MDNSIIILEDINNYDNNNLELYIFDVKNIFSNILEMSYISDDRFSILFQCMFNNYLLILFTLTFTTTILCCQNNNRQKYKYKIISQKEENDSLKKIPV